MNILIVAGLFAAAFFGASAWSKWDATNEKRRKAFSKLAVTLRSYGLTRMPDMLDDFVVGNWSGFFKSLYKFVDMLDDGDEVVLKDFNGIYESVQAKKLATAEGRAHIAAQLAAATPVATPAS